MAAKIYGNVVYWPANDVTPFKLEVGIKSIRVSTSPSVKLRGEKDTTFVAIANGALVSSGELPDVNGYPSVLTPYPHSTELFAFITPSPHINPNYAADCEKLLTEGYDA